MSNLVGADLEGMAELRSALERGADRLSDLLGLVSSGVADSHYIWSGAGAEEFRELWVRVHIPTMAAAATGLRRAASVVEQNRMDQAATSNDLGGFASSGTSRSGSVGGQATVNESAFPLGSWRFDIPGVDVELPSFDPPSWGEVWERGQTGFDRVQAAYHEATQRLDRAAGDAWEWGLEVVGDMWDRSLDVADPIFNAADDAAIWLVMNNLRVHRTVISSSLDGADMAVKTMLFGPVAPFVPISPVAGPVRSFWNRHVMPQAVGGLMGGLERFAGGPSESGDAGGWLERRQLADFTVSSGPGAERGRAVVAQALEDTDNEGRAPEDIRIRNDEFEVINHGNEHYTLVLPGVTDLSNPGRGLDPVTRSVRDTDVAAAPSTASAGVDDNLYAQYVKEYAIQHIPPGASLSIVGHSFGADTALDLAADPEFNGRRYNVTHVTAAAYHSEPQLASVPIQTEVLVLQNNKDVPVMVEEIGHASSVVDSLPFTPDDRWGEHVIVREFDGGWEGAGHHQNNYIDYVESSNDPDVDAFFEGLYESGYGESGKAESVDVSVPEGSGG